MSSTGNCATCGAEAKLKCASCQQVFYCCKEHQKSNWKQHKTACRPYTVQESRDLGKYLIANRNFQSGEVIMKNCPIVVGPPWYSTPMCLNCYASVDGSYLCTKCGFPMCNKKCEEGKAHQPECQAARSKGVKIKVDYFGEIHPMYQPILVLRCLSLKGQKEWEQLMRMESHLEQRNNTAVYQEEKETVVAVIRNVYKVTEFSEEDIHRVCGIIDVNALEIKVGDCEVMGLFQEVCLMEHSCIPNTKHKFDDHFKAVVQAAVPIEKRQHISTMYTNALWSTHARRDHLKCSKYFQCRCERCQDATEMGTEFGTMLCQEESEKGGHCGGFIRSTDPLDEVANWRCEKCDSIVPAGKVVEQNLKLGEQVESLQSCSGATIKDYEKLLSVLQEYVHKNHYQLFSMKHSLLQMYGRQGGSMQDLSNQQLQRKATLCEEVLGICKVLDPGSGRLNIYAAVTLLEQHLAVTEQIKRLKKKQAKRLVAKAEEALKAADLLLQDACSDVEIRMRRVLEQRAAAFHKYIHDIKFD